MRPRPAAPARWTGWTAWIALALGLLLGLAAPARADDPPGRVGRLAQLDGTVWRWDADEREWVEAARNEPLTAGDRLSTADGARAEVQVGSTTLRLDGRTALNVERLDDAAVRLRLVDGALALRVRADDVAGELEVVTEDGSLVPARSGHYRIDRVDGHATRVTVWDGAMAFDAPDARKLVDAGLTIEFWQRGEGEQAVTMQDRITTPRDDFARWALAEDARDREDERREASRHVSPEMTGWGELDRHGRWDTHPEYGAIWTPIRVEVGWAPYRHGRWMWVRPWGWTWVDAAPWGFAPFHYGRWVSWRGRWCWAPGHRVARPVFAPALVAWVGGSNVQASITIGAGRPRPPVIGWLPLAPREPYRPHYHVSPRHWDRLNPGLPRDRVPSRPDRDDAQRHDGGGWRNRDVPGAVTFVSADALARRAAIDDRVVQRLDPREARELAGKPLEDRQLPQPVRRAGLVGEPDRDGRAGGREPRPGRDGAIDRPGAEVGPSSSPAVAPRGNDGRAPQGAAERWRDRPVPERSPERMPDRMPERSADRSPDRMPDQRASERADAPVGRGVGDERADGRADDRVGARVDDRPERHDRSEGRPAWRPPRDMPDGRPVVRPEGRRDERPDDRPAERAGRDADRVVRSAPPAVISAPSPAVNPSPGLRGREGEREAARGGPRDRDPERERFGRPGLRERPI